MLCPARDDLASVTKKLIHATLGLKTDSKVTNDLQRYCLNVINSGGPAKDDDIVNKVEKQLALKRDVKTAAEFSKRYTDLVQKKGLGAPRQMLEFLYQVSQNNEREPAFNSGVKVASTPLHAQLSSLQNPLKYPDPGPLRLGDSGSLRPGAWSAGASISAIHVGSSSSDLLVNEQHNVPSLPPSGRRNDTGSSGFASASRTIQSQNRTLQVSGQQTQDTAYGQYKAVYKDEVQEEELVRDILLVAQGIEGKLAKFDIKADAYRLPDNLNVPAHKRSMCHQLFEAGWLYNRIKQYLDNKKGDSTCGPIGQSFCVALQHELTAYHRLLAVLDTQRHLPDPDVTQGLTLHRLLIWFHEPIFNLRLAACLVDIAKGKKGGALLSAVHSYIWHGDPRHVSLVSHALGVSVTPLFEVINRWIYTGYLDDPYNEFFVAADPQVQDDGLWHFKYTLRKSMIPSFISPEMARKIMLTGKSVVYVHRVCQDTTQLELRESISRARIYDATSMFTQERQDAFQMMIDVAYKEISRHLMEVLREKYNFMNHLKAMRRYLLLGQGDFIQQLMDLLVDELSKDASALYIHNLNGILETAIRATNAQFDDKDILSRLDVRLLEISPGDLGWDVFSLDYRTRGPIQTVFTQDTMIFYLRIFNFLWRAKRMEYALANMWRLKQQHSRMLRAMVEVEDLLHTSHIIASEMIHFTQQIGYYINFEVLECSWDEMLSRVEQAEDLDQIIAAHQTFLDKIVTRCLMDEAHRDVFTQLRTIFDLIIRFQLLLENFFEDSSRERENRESFLRRQQKSTDKAEWALTEEEETIEKQRRAQFIQETVKPVRSQLKVLGKTYQDMVTKFLVMLATQSDYDLQCLRFRLDFNEFYQNKEPILSSPQVLKKHQPRRPGSASSTNQLTPPGTSLVGVLGGRVPELGPSAQ